MHLSSTTLTRRIFHILISSKCSFLSVDFWPSLVFSSLLKHIYFCKCHELLFPLLLTLYCLLPSDKIKWHRFIFCLHFVCFVSWKNWHDGYSGCVMWYWRIESLLMSRKKVFWWVDRKPSDELKECLGLVSIRNYIQMGTLRQFGHVGRTEKNSWIKKCREIVVGHRWRCRPRKTWDEVIWDNLRVLNDMVQDRVKWKFAIK